jgi:hypothetical protein
MTQTVNLSIILPRPRLGAISSLVRLSGIASYVLFPYLFMSGFQRLSLICVTALEKGKSVFRQG